MKKLGFTLVGLLIIALIYYAANGSAHITEKAKQQLNHELETLQQNGFSVKERKSEPKQDHFIISFDKPEKITHYLNTLGEEITQEEAKALQGFQVGIDATYLPDASSALSLDLYPVTLPKSMLQDLGNEDKKRIEHLKGMLAKKALLLHINFNTMLSGFTGYIKDINETVEESGEKAVIAVNGITFKGELKEDKIHTFSQDISLISLDEGKDLQVTISGINGGYTITGPTPYDMNSHYYAKSIAVNSGPAISVFAKAIENESHNSIHDGLLKSIIRTKVKTIEFNEGKKRHITEDILFDFSADNIDIAAIEALQKTNPKEETRINQLTQQLLSKGIRFTLNRFSAEKITENGTTMNGFDMNGTVQIAKSLNLDAISQNPLLALDAIKIRTHMEVSDTLYTLMVQDPRAMIMMMMAPPVAKKGTKVYDIDFSGGKLTINGTSF